MTDEQETNHAFARSLSNAGLGGKEIAELRSEYLRKVIDVVTKADDEKLRRMIWHSLDHMTADSTIHQFAWIIGLAEAERRDIAI
ncbi:MAG: hypothetical protein ACYC05_11685 [Sulfuricella sp.]|nr:hypothetical protein [Gammaproteobacteria bacterium]